MVELCSFTLTSTSGLSETSFLSLAHQYITQGSNTGRNPPCKCDILRVDNNTTEAGQAILPCDKPGHCEWLVSQAMGRDKSYSLAREDTKAMGGQALRLLPVGGVALPLTRNSPQSAIIPAKLEQSRLYCFLPLPSSDGIPLPVHVNGYFSVSSDRRHLYEPDTSDKHDPKAAWNVALMKDAVSQAYINLVTHITETTPSESLTTEEYYNIWPVALKGKLPGLVGQLGNSFMEVVCRENGPKVFKGSSGWISLQQCRFADNDVINSDICNVIEETVNDMESQGGKEFLILPTHILDSVKSKLQSDRADIHIVNMPTLFQDIILPHLPSVPQKQRDRLLLYALQSGGLRDILGRVSCIPVTPDGSTLKMPSELIHPKGPLADLYSPEEGKCPHFDGITAGNNIYWALQEIGMRYDDVPWEEVAERCESVAVLAEDKKMMERAKVLTQLLQEKTAVKPKNSTTSSQKEIKIPPDILTRIQSSQFLPVLKKPEHYPLSWAGDRYTSVVSPSEAFSSTYTELLGSVVPILDQTRLVHSWSSVAIALACENTPSFDLIHKQLLNVIEAASSTDRLDSVILLKIESIFETVYRWLNNIEQDSKKLDLTNKLDGLTESDIQVLSRMTCMFIDSKLFYPSDCCLSGDSCSPYFHVLPDTMKKKHSDLWEAIPIKDKFDVCDLIRYLSKTHDSAQDENDITSGIKIAKMLANEMRAAKMDVAMVQEKHGTVFVPGQDGSMHTAGELCYNNCPWITESDRMLFCHPQITFDEAEIIGVKTIRAAMLDEISSPLGESFGQGEPLTQRIKRLLIGYPLGKGLVHEILQNADDAGATEVHFVLDQRHHSKQRVFGKCWEPLQGPSLCVYNNKPFTQEDIEGIQHLGMGSKVTDPTKTGQYGLGFNSMYHLTDTPTIFTDVIGKGQTLCVFDPHCRYVPCATERHPGRMFRDIDNLQQTFPDVLAAYLPDMFSVDNSTLFRFPLRTEEQAEVSKICRDNISPAIVHRVLMDFQNEGSKALIFLHNIASVKITVIPEEGERKTVHNIEVQMKPKEDKRRKDFIPHLKEAGRNVRRGNVLDIPEQTATYTLTLTNNEQQEDWVVIQTLGFSKSIAVSDQILTAFRQNEMCLLPRGGVALPSSDIREEGTVFSILPVSMSSHMPVHINGHFALSYENRDNLANFESTEVHSAWNRCLFTDLICRAYVTLIQKIRDESKPGSLRYFHAIFPKTKSFEKDPYIREAFMSLYQTLADTNVKCLPVLSAHDDMGTRLHWYTPVSSDFHHQAYFNTLREQYTEKDNSYFKEMAIPGSYTGRDPPSKTVETILSEIGFPLLGHHAAFTRLSQLLIGNNRISHQRL